MSEFREVEHTFDLDIAKETARRLNLSIKENAYVLGYSVSDIEADLVIDGVIGIIKNENRLVFDDMYMEKVQDFLKEYFYTLFRSKGYNVKMDENEKEVIYAVY